MRNFTSLVGIMSVILATGLIVGCSPAEETMQEEEIREIPVQVDTVSYGTLSGSNELSGTIIPYEDVDVTPKANGEIVEIFVEKGDSVQAGTVLARLDDF